MKNRDLQLSVNGTLKYPSHLGMPGQIPEKNGHASAL
jgi:hypothetical protein